MKTATVLLSLMALALASGCASITSLDQDEIPTYTLNEIRSHPEVLTKTLTEESDGIIISVAQGETLPFDISARLPFATLVTGGNWIRFDRNVWFFFTENDILISPDGKRFGPVYNMRTLKKLFDFEAGELALGFGVSNVGGARAGLRMVSK